MILSVHEPTTAEIREFLAGQSTLPFSHDAPESSRPGCAPPRGYDVDHNRQKLGSGAGAFAAACAAVRRWEMFHLAWLEICCPDAPLVAGTFVAMKMPLFGLWWLNACRIVYVLEEKGVVDRFGFAYGTLPAHIERGEERFLVEWNHSDDSVWYDLYAFSRPRHPLARLGYPFVRSLQRRFARDSKAAMLRAVEQALRHDKKA